MHGIGEVLKRLRKSRNLTIRALAQLVNISHNTLASYERRSIMPSLENSYKLATFFNVPIEYLIIGDKSISQFNDVELLGLFKEVDSMCDEDRDIVKRFILKLVKNKKERERIRKEAD